MQWIELPISWIIILDVLAWLIFHIGISVLTLQLPDSFFESSALLYRIRPWERGGQFWQEKFKIKTVVKCIPDGSKVLGAGFDQKTLQQSDAAYLERFILETKRAELTHWLSIFPAGLFFIWNPPWAGWIMVAYALLFNGPIILLQRYNRPRLERIAVKREKAQRKE